jgi:aryl-alcohol dehydrogenase-like predicted oxidoreductase
LIERTVERDLLPMAKASDIGVTAWSPLGAGLLTGKYTKGNNDDVKRINPKDPFYAHHLSERNLEIAREVDQIAEEMGRSSSQVALNWVRQRNQGVIIPIIGARTEAQIKDNLGCLEFELTEEQMNRLNEISQIQLGFPHDMLAHGQMFMYGNTFPLTDNHRK